MATFTSARSLLSSRMTSTRCARRRTSRRAVSRCLCMRSGRARVCSRPRRRGELWGPLKHEEETAWHARMGGVSGILGMAWELFSSFSCFFCCLRRVHLVEMEGRCALRAQYASISNPDRHSNSICHASWYGCRMTTMSCASFITFSRFSAFSPAGSTSRVS